MKTTTKKKIWAYTFGFGAVIASAAIATSCGVSQTAVDKLFKVNSNLGGFTNSDSGKPDVVVKNALLDKSGFDTFLSAKLSDVLTFWYKNNEYQPIRNKYENFVSEVNDDWDNKVKEQKKSSGNNFPLDLQKNYLDANGGTEASWKQKQLNDKIMNDFSSSLFNELFLNYTDNNGNVIPASEKELNSEANWSKIKFTAGGKYDSKNPLSDLNETYADIQNAIFSKWVKEENPNLVSRVVFTNEDSKNGLEYLFDKNIIGSGNLASSYQFQAFKDNTNDPTTSKGMHAYKEMMSGTGLSQYVTTSGRIDIPNNLSSDSGGKLLMTASGMFGNFDVAFSSAFVQQYLSFISEPNKDNIGAEISLVNPNNNTNPSDPDKDARANIMSNFIRQPGKDPLSTNGATVTEPKTAYTENNLTFTNINPDLPASDNFYKVYKELGSSTNSPVIYNVVKPKSTNGSGNTTDKNKNFILARGKDGVHIMGIDGGEYYLTSTAGGTRDTSKQEAFLRYRAILASKNLIPSKISYTFDLKSELSTWFSKNRNQLIYSVLYDALKKQNSFASPAGANAKKNFFDLAKNEEFKNEFIKLSTTINDYVTSFASYEKALQLQNNINSMNAKLNEWASSFSNEEKNLTPFKIGIAARLPYVRATDGNYFGLSQYYFNTYGNSLNINAATDKNNSRAKVQQEIKNRFNDLKAKTQTLVDGLKIELAPTIEYSENLFIKSNNQSFDTALNTLIQAMISTTTITNSIKIDYFRKNAQFNKFYNWTDGSLQEIYKIPKATLEDIVRTYYKEPMWNSSSDRYALGAYTTQSELDKIVDTFWDAKRVTDFPNSDDAMSYYTYLYTFDWLIRDNLSNFKRMMSSAITQGVNAVVSWTVPANPDTLTDTNTFDPLSTFAKNPNYLQGSTTNWYNAEFQQPNSSVPTPDPFNDASNPYVYTNTRTTGNTNTKKLYGFSGISYDGNVATLDSNVGDAVFTNYSRSGFQGALTAYGSRQDLVDYVKAIKVITELDNLVTVLENRAQLDLSEYHQKVDNKDVLNFAGKKELILKKLSDKNLVKDELFTKFSGYIGDKKAPVALNADSAARLTAYKNSDPVIEGGNTKLTVMPTYIVQFNYKDVQRLGSPTWTTDDAANDASRLGLDLNTFLAIVALQASNDKTQSFALRDLVNANTVGTTKDWYTAGDKRIFNALTNTWITKTE